MDISHHITAIPPIPIDAHMNYVFEQFRTYKHFSLFPIVNASNEPLGIIREFDLKDYTYGMFGRELIKRESLHHFIQSCPVVSIESEIDDIFRSSANNQNLEGLIITKNGSYHGVLLNASLIAIHEENRDRITQLLMQSQKMEAIGTLAGGIAHDFNNILMPIMGYSELLKSNLSNDKITCDYIDQILVASARARDLVSQILTFSRQKKREPIPVHIGTMLKEIIKLLRPALPSTIEIKTSIETIDDTLNIDPSEFHQIIMNLCSNAEYAMRKSGGTLKIVLQDFSGPLKGFSENDQSEYGNFLKLTISDTGYGIDPLVISRIFEPFFTTKPAGEGTGMGLSVVHGIVKRYGGIITVESDPGKGTQFIMFFKKPVVMPKTFTQPDIQLKMVDGQNYNILFVDDEKMITEIAEETFPGLGFQITTHTNSFAAFDCFKAHPDSYHAVVTDITMPGMSGIELSQKILSIRPSVPIVVCTGFSNIITEEEAISMGISAYISKPVNFKDLASTLCSSIESKRMCAMLN